MRVRRLNEKGLHEFSLFIENLRTGVQQDIPLHLLASQAHSEEIPGQVEIEDKIFISRYEMGAYLVERFGKTNLQPYLGDAGFWSWLALLWFDQLCPKNKEGIRNPARFYNYILSNNRNYRLRHAIYTSWQLVNRYGEDACVLLCKEMPTRGEMTDQLMSKPELLTSVGVIQLASALYFDPSKRTFKKGAASRTSAGSISRYVNWLEQLQVTFDVFSMSKDELAALLPAEFQKFRPA
jgi:hypothetical protein